MSVEARRSKPKVKEVSSSRSDKVKENRNDNVRWMFKHGIIFVAIALGLFKFMSNYNQTPNASSKLPPNHGSTQAVPFVVADLPGKGKGLVATRDIQQGELLIREKPLFIVPPEITTSPMELITDSLRTVDASGQEAFWNLSYVNFPKSLDPKMHQDRVALAIFETNAVSAGSGVGIFPSMARLNHGCSKSFNVVYSWRSRDQVLVVHALKPIKKGEELLTTYTNTKQRRQDRRAYLQKHYGFLCTCGVCSMSDEESGLSDNRLLDMANEYGRFASWGSRKITGRQAVESARRIWQLGDKEGYWSERGQLAADVAWVAASHSDEIATRQWLELAIKWFTWELGGDSDQVLDLLSSVKQPQRHRAWRQRTAESVGGPEVD